MRSLKRYLFIFFPLLSIALFCSTGHSTEGLQWERFRLLPALSISELYTDNVYLTPADTRGDVVTTVSPKASLDFALAPKNIVSARYNADFRSYERSDNFKEYIYQTGLSWTLTAPLGSTFKADAGADHNSIQPYSALDTHKDYVMREAFADVLLKSLLYADIGLRYDHTSRTFTDEVNDLDDFDRDTVTLNATYWKLPLTGFLVEYTYSRQNNYNLPLSQKMDMQTILAGVQWDPTAKLSGHLKVGYYSTKVEEGDNSGGLDMDTDLAYKATDFTRVGVAAFRRLIRTTIVERETGEFYVSTGGTVSTAYSRWEPVTVSTDVTYVHNTFSQAGFLPSGERVDDLFSAGVAAKYSLKDWLSFVVSCKYKVNDSNYAAYGYRENRAEARLTLAI